MSKILKVNYVLEKAIQVNIVANAVDNINKSKKNSKKGRNGSGKTMLGAKVPHSSFDCLAKLCQKFKR